MSERDQLVQAAEKSTNASETQNAIHEQLFTLGYPSGKEQFVQPRDQGTLIDLSGKADSAITLFQERETSSGQSGSPELNRLLENADKEKGHELWKGELPDEMRTVSGAVAIRKVLQESGLDVKDNGKSVRELTDSLIKDCGWTKDSDLNHRQPGDLLVTQGESHGWISLVGDHSFYGNSLRGTWQEVAAPSAHEGETFLLHLPEKH